MSTPCPCGVCGWGTLTDGGVRYCPNPACNHVTAESVDHPSHYNQGGVECIDAIEAALTPEEFRGYCKGNAMKYVWRERRKGGSESVSKAAWYLARLLGT